jgi:hypothetical protein
MLRNGLRDCLWRGRGLRRVLRHVWVGVGSSRAPGVARCSNTP